MLTRFNGIIEVIAQIENLLAFLSAWYYNLSVIICEQCAQKQREPTGVFVAQFLCNTRFDIITYSIETFGQGWHPVGAERKENITSYVIDA